MREAATAALGIGIHQVRLKLQARSLVAFVAGAIKIWEDCHIQPRAGEAAVRAARLVKRLDGRKTCVDVAAPSRANPLCTMHGHS